MEVAIYAVLAIFIFARLYLALGRGDGSARSRSKVVHLDFDNANIKKVDSNKEEVEDEIDFLSQENLEDLKSNIEKIKKRDQRFSVKKFMTGAEKAFEIILKAFAESDLKTLQSLLDKEAFLHLERKIKTREKNCEKLENTLIAISKKELESLNIEKDKIFATVYFASEQINAFKDYEDQVISGDLKSAVLVEDKWVFVRKINSSSPAWKVCKI